MPDRPTLPTPPEHLPLTRGGRPRKAWSYAGVFTDELLLCAAVARIGPLPVAWWAVWDREQRTLAEHTLRGRSANVVVVEGGRVRVADGPVSIELDLESDPGAGVETISPHGEQYIWTRKQGGVPVRGRVTLLDRTREIEGFGVLDESAGYHARHTSWCWSAGVGVAESGAAVAWNLVDGIHDAAGASERTVWVDAVAHEAGATRFAGDLSWLESDGVRLDFHAEATREREERLLAFASRYEQPFGSFSGSLPVAGALRSGLGVMERHDVSW